MISFLARESCVASGWAGGWHGRERRGFQGFQEAGLRLRTDYSGNRLSPSGSSLVAANLRLAELRYVSEFPGAEGFPSVLGNKARRPAVCGHRRALQTDQACRTTRRGRSLPAALTRGRRALEVISVARAKLVSGNLLSSRRPIQRDHNPAFSARRRR